MFQHYLLLQALMLKKMILHRWAGMKTGLEWPIWLYMSTCHAHIYTLLNLFHTGPIMQHHYLLQLGGDDVYSWAGMKTGLEWLIWLYMSICHAHIYTLLKLFHTWHYDVTLFLFYKTSYLNGKFNCT